MELVSVIIPVYNSGQTIKKCLTSVLSSTCATYELEVIVVNNGSTDNTEEIVTDLCKRDSRIKFYSQENRGPAGSRNTGLDNATGDYITFCDSDDWVEPQWIDSMVNNLRMYNADMACCQPFRVHEVDDDTIWTGQKTYTKIWSREKAMEAFLDHKIFNGCLFLKLFRSSCIGDVRMNPDQWYLEDEPFVWQVLQRCGVVIMEDTRYYHWYLHSKSLCNESFSDKKVFGGKWSADMVAKRYVGEPKNIFEKALMFQFRGYLDLLQKISYYKINSRYELEIVTKVKETGLKGYKYLNNPFDKVVFSSVLVSYNFTKKILGFYCFLKKTHPNIDKSRSK